ncbi:MAG: AI-2E family transporter, partial [Thermoanaerobaculia bacterium]
MSVVHLAGDTPDPGSRRASWILLGVLTALGLYLSWRILQPFATVILWAGILALLFKPLQRRLVERTKKPNLAATITLIVALFSVLIPLAGVSLAVANEIGTLLDEAPAKWNAWVGNPVNKERLDRLQQDLKARFPVAGGIDGERIKTNVAALGEKLLKLSVGIAGNLLQGVVRFVIIAFSLFFLLRDGDKFELALRQVLPLSSRQSDHLISHTAEIVQASVVGVVAVAGIQGAIGGLTFALLGLPSPVLWGVVMAFLAMVPMVGAGVIWLPAALFLLATGSPGKALALVLIGTLIISTIDNFLRPRLVGGRTGLHELVVFFAVLGGLEVFGLVGLLVGPAILAVAWILLDLFRSSDPGSAEKS